VSPLIFSLCFAYVSFTSTSTGTAPILTRCDRACLSLATDAMMLAHSSSKASGSAAFSNSQTSTPQYNYYETSLQSVLLRMRAFLPSRLRVTRTTPSSMSLIFSSDWRARIKTRLSNSSSAALQLQSCATRVKTCMYVCIRMYVCMYACMYTYASQAAPRCICNRTYMYIYNTRKHTHTLVPPRFTNFWRCTLPDLPTCTRAPAEPATDSSVAARSRRVYSSLIPSRSKSLRRASGAWTRLWSARLALPTTCFALEFAAYVITCVCVCGVCVCVCVCVCACACVCVCVCDNLAHTGRSDGAMAILF
jgi:hypothetical protein